MAGGNGKPEPASDAIDVRNSTIEDFCCAGAFNYGRRSRNRGLCKLKKAAASRKSINGPILPFRPMRRKGKARLVGGVFMSTPEAAASALEFSPARRDGAPVGMPVLLPVHYRHPAADSAARAASDTTDGRAE